jgi:hypothetical protein
VVFADNVVRAEIHFRIAPDRLYGTGPAAESPSIAAGSLTFVVAGRKRTYDIAKILPIRGTHILLPTGHNDGCGATAPLSRHGTYLTIEAVVAEKGCAPLAAFVDIVTGRVAEDVVIDPAWDHRNDPHPEVFTGETLQVTRARIVSIAGAQWNSDTNTPEPKPWRFAMVDAKDRHGASRLVAYEARPGGYGPSDAKPEDEALPTIGSFVSIGSVPNRTFALVLFFDSERVLHLSAPDESRYLARQSPAPEIEGSGREIPLFERADESAGRAPFDMAVPDFATMLNYETGPTPGEETYEVFGPCRARDPQVPGGVPPSSAFLMSPSVASLMFPFTASPSPCGYEARVQTTGAFTTRLVPPMRPSSPSPS